MSQIRPRLLELPEEETAVILDYIALDYTRINISNKSCVVDVEPKRLEDCPVRSITEHDSAEQGNILQELALKPVAMFRDPFRRGKNKIVFCELQYFDGKELAINSRQQCLKITERFKEEDTWIGFEQEYLFVDDDGIPCDFKEYIKNPDSVITYVHENIFAAKETGCKLFRGSNVAKEREIQELHMKACIYAGIRMFGGQREDFPSMWEYQLAPLPIIEACDQLHVSRYILWRLTEMYGMNVSFFNPPAVMNTIGVIYLQANLSTRKMREEGGIEHIHKALENIVAKDQEVILQHYDLVVGNDYKRRLNGTNYSPKYDQTIIKVSDKTDSSLRIPIQVNKMGKGYFEERRPSAEADPYDVIRVLTAATFLNDEDFKRDIV